MHAIINNCKILTLITHSRPSRV